jgi:hypothetical protein
LASRLVNTTAGSFSSSGEQEAKKNRAILNVTIEQVSFLINDFFIRIELFLIVFDCF